MSRKSKSSTSRRRESVSEHPGQGSSVYYDEDADAESCSRDGGDRDSPVDEYSRSPVRRGSGGPLNSSPPLGHHPGPFEFAVPSSANIITQPAVLPWENRLQPHNLPTPTGSFASSGDDGSSGGGGGSGSSNGSLGTVHGGSMHSQYNQQGGSYFAAPHHPSPGIGNAYSSMHRGRAMNLEGIHARFDAGLAFSPMPHEPARSQSLNIGPSSGGFDWRGFGGQNDNPFPLVPEGENRRNSLLSLDSSRSTSSQSTSNSSKLQSGGASSSNSSSPASVSSWSQPPNQNAASGSWSSFSSKPHEHVQSPLVPGGPPAPGMGNLGYRSPLPSHIQHHPEHVPSAVPPPAPSTAPSRRATLPSLYNFGGDNSKQWSPSLIPGQVSSPTAYAQPSSPFGELPVPSGLPESSSTYRLPSMSSYFPQQQTQQGPTAMDVKFNPSAPSELHHPRAVTASGVPGSWEASQSSSGSSGSFEYPSRTTQYQQSSPYSPSQQYTIPGPNEVFESVVPQAPSWS